MNNYLLSDSNQGSLFNGKNVNCGAKISTLSHVATCTEVPVLFLPPNPPQRRQQTETFPSHQRTVLYCFFPSPNQTVLNRKESTEFCSLLSNLLFRLCCLKVRWSHKSSLHAGHHLALCQMLTTREMQFMLLTLTERKKNPEKKKKQTCRNLYALFFSPSLTGKPAFVLQCYFITLISNFNDCWN